MSQKPFNWSLLDRDNLYGMLYSIKNDVVNRRLPVREVQKILSAHIKKFLPIKVVMNQDSKNEKGYIYVGGTYYAAYDQEGRRQVEILFSYCDLNDSVKLTELRWKRLCVLFADTILHEIIHMRQYRTRNFKSIPGYLSVADRAKDRRNQEYYGHKDEMGAFSFNIACELYEKYGDNFDAIKKFLDSNQAKRSKKTIYYKYLDTFNWDHKHPVIRSLKKRIIRNLPNAQIGKPFKTSDYLTY